MKSKVATISAICAGGITIGATATVAVLLLTGKSELSEYSDRELFIKGFETAFSYDEESACIETLKNLEGKPLTSNVEFKINDIYEADELDGLGMGFTSNVDITETKYGYTFYYDSPELTDAVDGSFYLDSEKFAFATNLLNDVMYANIEDFVENYNNSDLYSVFGELNFTQEELNNLLTMYSQAESQFGDEDVIVNLKTKLAEKLDEDINTLLDDVVFTREDSSEEINGFDTYCLSAEIKTSDVLQILYNQIQLILTDEEFITFFEETYGSYISEFATTSNTSVSPRDILAEASLGLTVAYGTVENEFIKYIGETIPVYMYYTEDARLVKIESTVEIDISSHNDDERVENKFITLSADYTGEENLKDNTKITFKIYDDEHFIKFSCSDVKTENGSSVVFSYEDSEETSASIKFDNTIDGNSFKYVISVLKNDSELFIANIDGTFEITDTSILLDASSIKLTMSGLTLLDCSFKCSIKELTDDITMPEGNSIDILELTEEEITEIGLELKKAVEIICPSMIIEESDTEF